MMPSGHKKNGDVSQYGISNFREEQGAEGGAENGVSAAALSPRLRRM